MYYRCSTIGNVVKSVSLALVRCGGGVAYAYSFIRTQRMKIEHIEIYPLGLGPDLVNTNLIDLCLKRNPPFL